MCIALLAAMANVSSHCSSCVLPFLVGCGVGYICPCSIAFRLRRYPRAESKQTFSILMSCFSGMYVKKSVPPVVSIRCHDGSIIVFVAFISDTGEYESDGNVASHPSGAIFFRDLARGRTRKLLENGKLSENATITSGYGTPAFDSDGRFYLSREAQLVVCNHDAKPFGLAA